MITHRLARPFLAGIFVWSGIDVLRNPEPRLASADKVAPALARMVGLPEDTRMLVRLNAGVQLGAGALLAAGRLPRLASLTLAASLVPVTLAGHRFWEEQDPDTRNQHRTQFLKNAAIFGGLVLSATDTDGRPSVGWLAQRAIGRASGKLDDAVERAGQALPMRPGN